MNKPEDVNPLIAEKIIVKTHINVLEQNRF